MDLGASSTSCRFSCSLIDCASRGGGAVLNSYNPHNILHNAGRIDMEMNSPVKQLQILRPQIFVLLDRHGIVQDMVLNAAMKIKDNIELDGLMSLP